jgi:hypothetical protein
MPLFGEARFVLYLSVPYYILISKGIFSFPKKAGAAIIILIALAGVVFLYEYYHVEKRIRIKEVFTYIQERIKADEKAAFIIDGSRNPLSPPIPLEYGMLKLCSLPIVGISTGDAIEKTNLLEFCIPEELSYKGIWLVTWDLSDRYELNHKLIERIKNKYSLIDSISGNSLSPPSFTVYHFRQKDS